MENNNPELYEQIIATGCSVKVMRSYDYCHFEVSLSADIPLTRDGANDLRKEAARLVDEAVRQYKKAKDFESKKSLAHDLYSLDDLEKKVRAIKENFPMSEWTPQQKAVVKSYNDAIYAINNDYDYQDNWDEPE